MFPGSTRAAVYGMNVRLGDRLITAQIREKQQARIEYDTAKKEGKTAALLEQHLPNVFQMNVANILPGDDVKVELRYTELLVPQAGNYQFVFPTVVGPRYNSPQSRAGAAPAGWPSRTCAPASRRARAFELKVAHRHAARPQGSCARPAHAHRGDADRRRPSAPQRRRWRRRRAHAQQPRLHPRLPARPATRIESGLMLYRGQGQTPRTSSWRWSSRRSRWPPSSIIAARLHLRGRHLGLDARLSAGHRQGRCCAS